MNRLIYFAALLSFGIFAEAAPVQYSFTVTDLEERREDPLTGELVSATSEQQMFEGVTSFSGTFWYDPDTPQGALGFTCDPSSAVNPPEQCDLYLNTITNLQGSVGGNVFGIANSGLDVMEKNGGPDGTSDAFINLSLSFGAFLQVVNDTFQVSDGVDTFEFYEFFTLFSSTENGGSFYDPDKLPGQLPPPGSDVARMQLYFQDTVNGIDHSLGGNLTVQVIPVPAAVWLFASGLAGLGWIRRKQLV